MRHRRTFRQSPWRRVLDQNDPETIPTPHGPVAEEKAVCFFDLLPAHDVHRESTKPTGGVVTGIEGTSGLIRKGVMTLTFYPDLEACELCLRASYQETVDRDEQKLKLWTRARRSSGRAQSLANSPFNCKVCEICDLWSP